MAVKIIAYYLPQFHPFKENDEWWGKGFTEWTNVAKARPLFRGHYQPHVPADLGFYDLRLSAIREEQAKMASKAGVYGFCYWHYYFGNGKELMQTPINEVVASEKPSFPFCLGWANESWQAKVWNTDGSTRGKTLIEQTYQGDEDILMHFEKILSIVRDKRYIRVDEKPLFLIYRPLSLPYFSRMKELWNQKLKEYGIADSFYFVAHSIKSEDNAKILSIGYDAINMMRNGAYRWDSKCAKANAFALIRARLFNTPIRLKYSKMIKYFKNHEDCADNIFPSIIPNWDHTPRSGKRGTVFVGVTPELFKQHVMEILEEIKEKPENRQIVFLKSWNEWGEGNYIEPDLKYGHSMLDALKEGIIDSSRK